jgi:osmotically-inducible protein OsmY
MTRSSQSGRGSLGDVGVPSAVRAAMNDQPVAALQPDAVAELEARVQRLGGRIREFRVEVSEKGVVLRGYCRTHYARQLALHAVMEATGLPIAANKIVVTRAQSMPPISRPEVAGDAD